MEIFFDPLVFPCTSHILWLREMFALLVEEYITPVEHFATYVPQLSDDEERTQPECGETRRKQGVDPTAWHVRHFLFPFSIRSLPPHRLFNNFPKQRALPVVFV